jgi:membrane protein insertase Oxa1/YidC/SpoIIIJ
MNFNKDANEQDFHIMKQVDRQYGEQNKVAKPKKEKEKQKYRQDFTKMSVDDIMAMQEDYDENYDDELVDE